MNKDKLELYLGKKVSITLYDGDNPSGILIKGYDNEKGYYSCGDHYWFRSSHVTKIVEAGA